MAPEIVMKEEYCGPPSDIWAMGVLFYALLCGRFPFKGATDKELYTKINAVDLSFPPDISDLSKEFIMKIFGRNP